MKKKNNTYIESEVDKFLEKLVMIIIKVNLIQKKLLNHLNSYVINLLILANLKRSIINLWIMLKILKILNIIRRKVVFLKTKKKKKKMERNARDLEDIGDLYNIRSDSDTSKKDSDTSKKDSEQVKKVKD